MKHLCTLMILFLPAITLAEGFVPLTDIHFMSTKPDGIESYMNALYGLSIAVAAVLVVLKIIMAGVKYMFSEVITNKEAAKKDITGALLGLIIILGAVTILKEINPNLLQFDALSPQKAAPFKDTNKNKDLLKNAPSVNGELNRPRNGGNGF